MDAQSLTVVSVPRSRLAMLAMKRAARVAAETTVRNFRNDAVERVVILMAHPWDLELTRAAKAAGFEVAQVIHDARSHPGDMWPPAFAIRRRAGSADLTICLSQHVATELAPYAHAIRVAPHPAEFYAASSEPKRRENDGDKLVMFVGRIRKYKGIELLWKAWQLVETPNCRLVITGQGGLPRLPVPSGVEIRNEWMSESDIEEVITQANLIVCPYTEASQSGIVPLAHAAGVPVVVTPVGGLIEQVTDGVNGLVAASLNPVDLAQAIDRALSREWILSPSQASNADFISAIAR